MARLNHVVVLCASSALCPWIGGSALAQEASGDAGADLQVPGDIIVTARRTEERLQDVPISITVYNQRQLDDRNVVSGKDLATYVPSLSVNSRFGTENASFSIRGFAQESRTQPSVATYFADVVAPRGGGSTTSGDNAGPGSFFDLQNVQVLKGPQGTLFGRNTTGGAILLVPTKPVDRFEGYLEGSYGNYDMMRLQGVVNTPLGDSARLRLGFDRMKRDGYLRNVSGIGPDDFNDSNYLALRASLVVDLTPDLDNYLIASYSRSSVNGQISRLAECRPAVAIYGPLACGSLQRVDARGTYTVDNGLPGAGTTLTQWQLINTTTWRANDRVTIKNIASYAQLRNVSRIQTFAPRFEIPAGTLSGIPTGSYAGASIPFVYSVPLHLGTGNADQSTFTEELQVQGGSPGSALTWQAGAYMEISDPNGVYGQRAPSQLSCTDVYAFQCTDVIGALRGMQGRVGNYAFSATSSRYRTYAIYGQASYAISPQLTITGGLRYTWDKTESLGEKVTYRFFTPNVPVGFCLNPLVRPSNQPITSPTQCDQNFEVSSNAPTWLIDIDYKPAEDILLYAKYSRGYRQGSTNPLGADGYETFRPEKIDAYEIGAKTSFSGPLRGTLNIAGFYNDFTDQQLQVAFRSSTNAVSPNAGIVNAGKSRIYGAEVEATLTPFEGLNLTASYSYLNTKLVTLAPVPLVPGSLYNIVSFTTAVGARLPFAPEHKATVSATYTLPVPESVGVVSLGATYTYNGDIVINSLSPLGTLPSYNLLNLNLNWTRVGGSPVDLSVFVTNAIKETFFTYLDDQLAGSGFLNKYLGEPRMIGGRIRYHF